MNYLSLFSAVAPVFVVMIAGYGIRRAGWLSAEADASLLLMVVNLLYPCLILDTILGNPAMDIPANVMLAPPVGFITVVAGYFICWYAAPLFGLRDGPERRTFAFAAGIYNYGYIALPLVEKIFGKQAAGVLFLHNVGVEAALWTVGIMLLTGTSPRQGWKKIFSAPVLAILLAMLLNFSGARQWMPSFILQAVHAMGAAAIPLGLVLTGAIFADQMHAGDEPRPGSARLGAVVIRLGLLPLLQLAIARWLPCPAELRHVIIVQAAMPSAVVPVILSKHFGGDAATALRVVLVTNVLALLTIPLWLNLGLRVAPG